MKRQRAKQRPLYRYDVYRGRRRGQARLIGAAGCAVFGLLLVLIRSLGIRFSGFLLLGLAALLVLSWLLDRLAAGNHRWRLIHRGFYGCLTVGLAALLGLEVFIINRGRSDMTPPCRQTRSSSWGRGSTALSRPCPCGPGWTRPWTIWSGGRTSRQCSPAAPAMARRSARRRACTTTSRPMAWSRGGLILEDQASNTAENFALSKPPAV